MTLSFGYFELRTTDVNDAQLFYRALFGQLAYPIVSLSPQAKTHGAPAHWIGFVSVPSVKESLGKFMLAGAQVINSKSNASDLTDPVTIKGPGGEVVGLKVSNNGHNPNLVGYSQLIVPNPANVISAYADILGWQYWYKPKSEHGPAHHLIASESEKTPSGIVVDTKDLPGSHPHWLYFFQVSSLTNAVDEIRRLSGDVFGVYTLPTGRKAAVCHDRQGAAFGVCE